MSALPRAVRASRPICGMLVLGYAWLGAGQAVVIVDPLSNSKKLPVWGVCIARHCGPMIQALQRPPHNNYRLSRAR